MAVALQGEARHSLEPSAYTHSSRAVGEGVGFRSLEMQGRFEEIWWQQDLV